jgi:hypothetical protein
LETHFCYRKSQNINSTLEICILLIGKLSIRLYKGGNYNMLQNMINENDDLKAVMTYYQLNMIRNIDWSDIIKNEKLLDLKELNKSDIFRILIKKHQWICKFSKLDLDKLNGTDIRSLLIEHPKLINSFDLNKLNTCDIYQLLIFHSELKIHFPNYKP